MIETTTEELRRMLFKLNQRHKTLCAQNAELLAALRVVWEAAIDKNAPLYLDEFMAEGRGRLGVYLTPAELAQLKQALARAETPGSKEI